MAFNAINCLGEASPDNSLENNSLENFGYFSLILPCHHHQFHKTEWIFIQRLTATNPQHPLKRLAMTFLLEITGDMFKIILLDLTHSFRPNVAHSTSAQTADGITQFKKAIPSSSCDCFFNLNFWVLKVALTQSWQD
ncbi:MAG: hypothetical protein ACP5D0_03085 [Hydrogenovibrio sp.]